MAMTPEEQSTKEIKSSLGLLIRKLRLFLRTILSIREGTDAEGTIDEVRSNVVFKGPSVWILICSIFIASIGLNVNSTAVIIGAMLISPLMGPIVGIGLAVGTNDVPLLKKSFKNVMVMVAISLLTSFIYFYITPLSEAQSELFARTQPTLLDVMVALFGGMAGIIAGSRDEKSNVIPGVAIATALMPPLCTAGYGLAKMNFEFFFGAFYLFLLNSIFISISTLVVVRYLRFPSVSFVDEFKKRRVKTWITIISILVIVPSGFIFYGIIKESIFKADAEAYVAQYMTFEHTEVISKKITHTDSTSVIEVFLIGEILPDSRIKELKRQLVDYGLVDTKLKVNQAKDESTTIAGKLSEQVKTGIIEEMYKKNEAALIDKDERIALLENELVHYKQHTIPFEDLQSELAAVYPNMQQISYANMLSGSLTSSADTTFTFMVSLHNNLPYGAIRSQQNQLEPYLKEYWLAQVLV